MLAGVVLLFERGVRKPQAASFDPPIVGSLHMTRTGHRNTLSVHEGALISVRLHEPRFAGVSMYGLYLDGIEIIGHVEYRQGWLLVARTGGAAACRATASKAPRED